MSNDDLFRKYYDKLLNYAISKLPTRQDAEDVVSEVFVSLCRYPDALQGIVSVESYLMKITKNEVARFYRNHKVVNLTTSEVPTPDAEVIASETEDKITLAFESVTDSQDREAGRLRYVEGLPYREIAERLNINRSQAVASVRRCGLKLKDALKDYVTLDNQQTK